MTIPLDGGREGSGPKRRILCVQPVREHHRPLQLALADHHLEIAHTGLDAVRAHNLAPFDAYVLDYWLPDWSGLSLCRQVRKDDLHAPVLFFSSAEGEDQRKRAMRAGADAYLHASAGADALATELRKVSACADVRSLRAKLEAERAVQEELERRAALVIEHSELARTRAGEALERAAKARAKKAFMEAGGTLGHFSRWWPQVFSSVAAGKLVSGGEAVVGGESA
ncbi:MAG TPA: response regulator [Burkholderiales bacterium]|nr:response regulator [Burkholderiales bacterium]